ncbi:hypothetical protein FJY93_01730 [Candidatus Kaiserbacteria bacterium]|nr:hypothetical protein [Candidatus Kaiserbacteria bacterium]
MRTDSPTTLIYFVFAHTYCMMRAYPDQEQFVRRILAYYDVEFLEGNERGSWQEFDVPMTLRLISDVLPELSADAMLPTGEMVKRFAAKFGIE